MRISRICLPCDSILEDDDAAISGVLPGWLRTDDDRVALLLERFGHEVVLCQVLSEDLKKLE